MCKDCIKNVTPNRGTRIIESGAFLENFSGCVNCGCSEEPIDGKWEDSCEEGSDDEEENFYYKHICATCEHKICEHWYGYDWSRESGTIDYSMSCWLCGKGNHSSPAKYDGYGRPIYDSQCGIKEDKKS